MGDHRTRPVRIGTQSPAASESSHNPTTSTISTQISSTNHPKQLSKVARPLAHSLGDNSNRFVYTFMFTAAAIWFYLANFSLSFNIEMENVSNLYANTESQARLVALGEWFVRLSANTEFQ
ncbi:hypothetical protein ACE6H2_006408 [Prunus campanulata]